MLQNLIRIPSPLPSDPPPIPEDIFSSALSFIFPDDVSALHGDPGSLVIYKSKPFGEITLMLSRPGSEEERWLMAQYLWNAGVLMAEIVGGGGSLDGGGVEEGEGGGSGSALDDGNAGEISLVGMTRKRHEDNWNVSGEKVLELGAGTGLAGIISMLAGAEEVVISDYPTPEILATIETNCRKNMPAAQFGKKIHVVGHEWGVLDDEFSKANARHFTRILAADCLWMVGEHRNLVASMLHFLANDVDVDDDNFHHSHHEDQDQDQDHENAKNENAKKKKTAQIWIVAGFHTGRATLTSFFKVAQEAGLNIKHIWERDAQGNEREWSVKELNKKSQQAEPDEDIASLKKWLVVAILERRK